MTVLGFFPTLPTTNLLSPLVPGEKVMAKKQKEVFGFIPYWNIDKTDNIDFETLTTLAYFDIPVKGSGDLDTQSHSYKVFKGEKATNLFKKAHEHGTRVVLTLTQMNNPTIRTFLDSEQAQATTIEQTVSEVQNRGIDGINIDFEYTGNPGDSYREKFTKFTADLTAAMHKADPSSYVTISVYAGSAKNPQMYDIGSLGEITDGIFMMAYDFAAYGAQHAMPTAPLYGYKEDEYYWYDVSSAVEDFLAQMPADKLILGLPWYGYDYAILGSEPETKAPTQQGYYQSYKYYYKYRGRTYWRWQRRFIEPTVNVQTYTKAQDALQPTKEGWDDIGKVGWKAYKEGGSWRMVFIEDERSLGEKYDFAEDKELAGIGIWALGFDSGKDELWQQLAEKFGKKDKGLVAQNKRVKNQYEF